MSQKSIHWKFIRHEGTYYHDIGRGADGALYNPNGYPEAVVVAAIAGAEERRRQRRSNGAKKAAQTRRKRTDARVYEVAQRIVDGHAFGPAGTCQICGRGVNDPDSIARGIGSDCWQTVLEVINAINTVSEPAAG